MTRRELLKSVEATYVSSTVGGSLVAKVFPSLAFYSRVTKTVFRASLHAQSGNFNHACWRDASREIREAFERCGAPVMVENLDLFERFKEPCVIIGNHMSTAETFLPAGFMVDICPVTYVVKQGLIEYPVFKHIMRATNPIVVGRNDPRQDLKTVMSVGQERLKAGVSVIIFPQKTRTVAFDPNDFNSIGVKLARKANVPVVPFAVKTDAWSNGKRLKDFGPFHPERPVHMAFGEPMPITHNGKEENAAIIEFIKDRLKTWEKWDALWQKAK